MIRHKIQNRSQKLQFSLSRFKIFDQRLVSFKMLLFPSCCIPLCNIRARIVVYNVYQVLTSCWIFFILDFKLFSKRAMSMSTYVILFLFVDLIVARFCLQKIFRKYKTKLTPNSHSHQDVKMQKPQKTF